MQRALAVHGAMARGAFAVAVLVSLAVLFSPGGNVPPAPPGVDKAVHLLLFLALAATGRWAGLRAAVLGVGLVVYAVVSEAAQALTPLARTGSLGDLLADVGGTGLGLAAWTAAERARQRRAAA